MLYIACYLFDEIIAYSEIFWAYKNFKTKWAQKACFFTILQVLKPHTVAMWTRLFQILSQGGVKRIIFKVVNLDSSIHIETIRNGYLYHSPNQGLQSLGIGFLMSGVQNFFSCLKRSRKPKTVKYSTCISCFNLEKTITTPISYHKI